MERRYWDPPDSIKLLMIILAVPVILLLGLLNLAWMMTRYAVFRLVRLIRGVAAERGAGAGGDRD